jgi:hypothetical protein
MSPSNSDYSPCAASIPKLVFPSSSTLLTPGRQPHQDYRCLTLITPLAPLSYPTFFIHLANPRQTDRSGLSPSSSDYSPCAAFIPELLFLSSLASSTPDIHSHQDNHRLTRITHSYANFCFLSSSPHQLRTSGLSLSTSDYSPHGTFAPELLFPSPSWGNRRVRIFAV